MKTNLIHLYVMVGDARRVFDDMGERNVVCWNSMLTGYMRYGDVDGATRVFMNSHLYTSHTTVTQTLPPPFHCDMMLIFCILIIDDADFLLYLLLIFFIFILLLLMWW